MAIHYLLGDATAPVKTPAIIAHVCNDCQPGKWGAGFVMALSKKDKRPENAYRQWADKGVTKNGLKYELGNVIVVPFQGSGDDSVVVANIIGQHGVRFQGKTPPIRYDAVEKALTKIANFAKSKGYSVHMPRIGCVLAGGKWEEIGPIVERTMNGVETYVYTLPDQKDQWDDPYENDGSPKKTRPVDVDVKLDLRIIGESKPSYHVVTDEGDGYDYLRTDGAEPEARHYKEWANQLSVVVDWLRKKAKTCAASQ